MGGNGEGTWGILVFTISDLARSFTAATDLFLVMYLFIFEPNVVALAIKVRQVGLVFRTDSPSQTRRRCMRDGNLCLAPSGASHTKLTQCYRQAGSVVDGARRGRRAPTSLAKVRTVLRAAAKDPALSVAQLAQETALPRSTVHRVLR